MANIILFGAGEIAQIAKQYLEDDSEHNVVAFTLDEAYIDADTFEGLPMVPFEKIEQTYPPSDYKMFIVLSYTSMNTLREKKYFEAKAKGYELISYISSRCSYLSKYECGDNCFIFEENTIQPFVKIGNNVTLWSGNHIGHHSEIKSHNFVSSQVVISGSCVLEPNCFLGVNATIGHKVTLAKGTLLGAGAIISKNTEEYGIYVPARTVKLEKSSLDIKL
jgi:sugar O-acyltransferase (sialic acid O-acetyltransferase NeuD family)